MASPVIFNPSSFAVLEAIDQPESSLAGCLIDCAKSRVSKSSRMFEHDTIPRDGSPDKSQRIGLLTL